MRNEHESRLGEMPVASQLLIGKSKPKVKIRSRCCRKTAKTVETISRKKMLNQSINVITMPIAIELILLMSLVAIVDIECRRGPPLRLARNATDESSNVTTTTPIKLSFPGQQQSRSTTTATTTTSELSFEFLNLKSIPSSQLCQIEGHDRVNSVSFADNQIESLQSRAFTCISFRLKILNLRNNRIELISDDAFSGLNNLHVLILEGNRLAQVPTSQVGGLYLPTLRHLNLAGNQIESVGLASFEPGAHLISLQLRANPLKAIHSQSFAKLSNLKTLTLSHLESRASHLNHFAGLGELRFLHLDQFGANLSSLEEPFCESSRKLAGLSLKANQLKRVPRFTNCLSLISLDLSYNNIQGTLDGNFSLQNNLIDLYLGHNQLEYLSERALVGLKRLQVLELAANKLKSIHTSAFVPVRASLYELDIANNGHLAALPASGLEGLISLKAYGNNQLRKLPAHLPAAKLLALTYAYHCCDYQKLPIAALRGADEKEAAAQSRLLPVVDESYTRQQDVRSTGHNEPDAHHIDQDNNGKVGHESLMSQLANLIFSKLSTFWSQSSPEQQQQAGKEADLDAIAARVRNRASRREHDGDDANSHNLSESVLWPTGDGDDEQQPPPPPDNQTELKFKQHKLSATVDDERQVVTRPEVARARRDEVSALQPPNGGATMIDELVWREMRKIRFAHSSLLGAARNEWPPSGDEVVRSAASSTLDNLNHQEANSMDSRGELQTTNRRTRRRRSRSYEEGARQVGRSSNANDKQVQCAPQPNAFQPCRDLFDSIWLRASVWLVFLLAFLGNICVIIVLGSVRPSSSTSALTSIMWFNAAHSKRHIDVPRFLVLNLALADLLMACYLGILALVDLSTLGEFRLYAIKWQYSTGCKLAGFLAVLSSELSVFILAIITLERNYAITNAVHLNRRLSLQKAMVIMFFGYVYALAMALMPLNGINDYRKFSICLPLEYEPHRPLLGSSSNLYLVMLISINTLSFVLLLSCYLRMYCAIRGSQAWNTNDLKIAKRMSVLVVTDFLCWSPIICVAIATLLGRHLVGPDGLKLLVIFVLPLNSVANPFLYAITTKKFKRDLAILKKRLRLEQAGRRLHLAGAYLACGWAHRKSSFDGGAGSPPGGGGGPGIPVASTMEQIYYRKSKHKLASGKLTMASVQVVGTAGKRANSRLSKQELLAAAALAGAPNQHRLAGSGRTGGSRLVRLNQHNFQSFERNDDFADQIALTHCPSCQRKLAAAAAAVVTASALEPTSLNTATLKRPLGRGTNTLVQPPPGTADGEGPVGPQQELSYLLERTSCTRPRIVLDAVEPVVGVAMAPLRLVDNLGSGGGQQLSASMAPNTASRTTSQSRAPSSVELLVGLDQDCANLDGYQQRACSADNPARSQNQANLTRLSCQTVLVSDKLTRSVLLAPQQNMSNEAFTPATNNNNNNRSVSACAYMWPASGGSLTARLAQNSNRPTANRATCYSCSCDMSQLGVPSAGRMPLSHQTSAGIAPVKHEILQEVGASSRVEGGCKERVGRPRRAKSINRLVLQPLAKAWSNLQLSLQSGLGGGSPSVSAHHQQQQQQQKSPLSQSIRKGSPVQSVRNQVGHKGDSRSPPNSSAAGSTEQDQLLLDEHEESVIIEDILQMSSPARRRLLRGSRRMSRSCDVILEQSYAGSSATTSGIHRASMTSGEPTTTSSSYYDQNDDQRILLATINQLSARRKKGARRRTQADHHRYTRRRPRRRQDLDENSQQQFVMSGADQRKVSFTRCRSWSPALLDKLEDCMYQIKSRIPGFNAREPPWQEEATTSSEAIDREQPSTSRRGGAGAVDEHDEEEGGETTSESRSSRSRSSSSSGAIVEDEEDEFNEVSLDEWTRNMRKKAPYTKSQASRRHRLKQQLSGNSDTLSGRTMGTTQTSISFDSSSNIPATLSSSLGRHSDDEARAGLAGHESHNANDDDE